MLEHLATVPAPRQRRGVRHSWCSLLAIAAAAVAAGACSLTAIAEWASDAPAHVLTVLGVRRDPLTGKHQAPHEATIRRALGHVDADALDRAVSSWILSRMPSTSNTPPAGHRPCQAIAIDGKTLRGARSRDGEAVHLLSAVEHHTGTVLAQTDVDGKTNEITRVRPLLAGLDLAGRVIIADALHTQRDHAEFLVAEKSAHYLLVVTRRLLSRIVGPFQQVRG
ncbi:ISAs1 family transposase [Microtetraspora malaysiensis]|uniref:ISAs1 family transposase n=1 Tax=Microtetraspora malaysiensis TaxID=161358 RepID=UPI003D90AF4F